MSGRNATFVISGNSPAGAAQASIGKPCGGLDEYSDFTVHAELIGAVGGTLDVYVQKKLSTDVWVDWIHFQSLAAAAPAVLYTASGDQVGGTAPVAVGKTNDAGTVGVPALAAGTVAPGHPGDTIRVFAVAGAGAAAAAITVRIDAQRPSW